MSKDEIGLKDLNIKVNPKFRKRYRVEAAGAELSLKEVLIQSFEAWLAARGKKLNDDEK